MVRVMQPSILASILVVIALWPLTDASVHADVSCPNATLRSQASDLPDCRAYEMVTPVYKDGAEVAIVGVAGDGSSLLGQSEGVFAGAASNVFGASGDKGTLGANYRFVRGDAGWWPQAIELPAFRYAFSILFDDTIDTDRILWFSSRLDQAPPGVESGDVPGDFVRREPDGSIVDLGPVFPPSTNADEIGESDYRYVGSSGELSNVLFTMSAHQWPEDPTTGPETLYEYIGGCGTPSECATAEPLLIGVDHESNVISRCGTQLGSGVEQTARRQNAVSEDGSKVFFTALACGSSPPVNELFARTDNGQSDAQTVAISEPSGHDCTECDTAQGMLASATFQAASRNGSRVFFTTNQPLLGSDGTNNVYEYDFGRAPGEKLLRISGGDATVSSPQAAVQGVVDISQDGSEVYFVAKGVLTTNSNGEGHHAEAGAYNLYLFEHDARYPAGHTAFVTTLSSASTALWSPSGDTKASITANDRFLVFTSPDRLTSGDTSAAPQAFEYDANTGRLVRVSIGQDGFKNNGNTNYAADAPKILGNGLHTAVSSPSAAAFDLTAADDGAVFFESADSLVPRAVNGNTNVYEYHEGNVYLISDGQDVRGVELDGVDASGENVFFNTHDQLVGQDTDSQLDTYDARVDGGFAEPIPTVPCVTDACQGPLSGVPQLVFPSSELQNGEITSRGTPPKKRTRKAGKHAAKPKRHKPRGHKRARRKHGAK